MRVVCKFVAAGAVPGVGDRLLAADGAFLCVPSLFEAPRSAEPGPGDPFPVSEPGKVYVERGPVEETVGKGDDHGAELLGEHVRFHVVHYPVFQPS